MEIDDASFDPMQHLNDAFIEAVAGGDVLEAEKYLNAGVNVDVYGGHALSLALKYGELEMFKMLLRRGADIHHKDILGGLIDREHNSVAFLKVALTHGLEVEKLIAVMPTIIITVNRFEEIDLIASHLKSAADKEAFIFSIFKQALKTNYVQVLTYLDEHYREEGEKFFAAHGENELKLAIVNDNIFTVDYLLEKDVHVSVDDAALAIENNNLEIFTRLHNALAPIDETTREIFFHTAIYYGVYEVARQFKISEERDRNIAVKAAYNLVCSGQFELFNDLLRNDVLKVADLPAKEMMDAFLFSGRPLKALTCLKSLIGEGFDPYAKGVTALRMAEKLGHEDFLDVVKDAIRLREEKTFQKDFGAHYTLNDLRYTYDERGYSGLARAVMMGRFEEVLKQAISQDGDVLTLHDLLSQQNDERLLDVMRRHGCLEAVLAPNLWQDDPVIRQGVLMHLAELKGTLAYDAFQNYHSIVEIRKGVQNPFILKRSSSQPKQ